MVKPGARSSAKKKREHSARTKPTAPTLDKLIQEATVDCYNESEQLTGLYTMIEEHLALPFTTHVLGVEVAVERVDLTQANEIVAVCRRGRARQAIPILELPLPVPPPRGAEWIQAYRRWARKA